MGWLGEYYSDTQGGTDILKFINGGFRRIPKYDFATGFKRDTNFKVNADSNNNNAANIRIGGNQITPNPFAVQSQPKTHDYAGTAKAAGYTPSTTPKTYDYAGVAAAAGYTPGGNAAPISNSWGWKDVGRAMDPGSIQGPLQPGQSTLGTATLPAKPEISTGAKIATALAGAGALWGAWSAIDQNNRDKRFNRALDRQINENKRLITETRFADQNAAVETGNLASQTVDELRMSKDPNDRQALSMGMGNAYNNMGNTFRFNADQRNQLNQQNSQFMQMKRPTTSPWLAGIKGGFEGLGGALSMGSSFMGVWDKIANPNKYFDLLGKKNNENSNGSGAVDPSLPY